LEGDCEFFYSKRDEKKCGLYSESLNATRISLQTTRDIYGLIP
jgi:hypothetical protein